MVCNRSGNTRLITALVATATLLGAGTAALAAGSGGEIRSVTADQYGNAIIITEGGAKVIAVGQGERMAQAFNATRDASATVDGENCRNVGVFVRGRGYMYGVGNGDPVPVLTKRVCD